MITKIRKGKRRRKNDSDYTTEKQTTNPARAATGSGQKKRNNVISPNHLDRASDRDKTDTSAASTTHCAKKNVSRTPEYSECKHRQSFNGIRHDTPDTKRRRPDEQINFKKITGLSDDKHEFQTSNFFHCCP
mmetsp:Transcript_22274/g.59238  ORF Transcript_22274/g.59238 Transcript_22274/m.59238 type:complete len:132 (+) Transcript_22274:127-522(+)